MRWRGEKDYILFQDKSLKTYIDLVSNTELHPNQGQMFSHGVSLLFSGAGLLSRPIFTEEPQDVIFPLDLPKSEIILNCAATGYPSPHYR